MHEDEGRAVVRYACQIGRWRGPDHDQCLTHFAFQLGKGKMQAGALPTKNVVMIRKLHLDTARSANSTGNEEECMGGTRGRQGEINNLR